MSSPDDDREWCGVRLILYRPELRWGLKQHRNPEGVRQNVLLAIENPIDESNVGITGEREEVSDFSRFEAWAV